MNAIVVDQWFEFFEKSCASKSTFKYEAASCYGVGCCGWVTSSPK